MLEFFIHKMPNSFSNSSRKQWTVCFAYRLVFPPTLLSGSSRFLRALQQNRAQSRLLYWLNKRALLIKRALKDVNFTWFYDDLLCYVVNTWGTWRELIITLTRQTSQCMTYVSSVLSFFRQPPTRCWKRIREGRSPGTSTHQLFKNNLWRGHLQIQITSPRQRPHETSDWDTPIGHQIHRKKFSAEARKWKSKRYIALCDIVPPGSAKPKTCFIRKMALDTKPAFSMANFQRAITHKKKRKIRQRHARESET